MEIYCLFQLNAFHSHIVVQFLSILSHVLLFLLALVCKYLGIGLQFLLQRPSKRHHVISCLGLRLQHVLDFGEVPDVGLNWVILVSLEKLHFFVVVL